LYDRLNPLGRRIRNRFRVIGRIIALNWYEENKKVLIRGVKGLIEKLFSRDVKLLRWGSWRISNIINCLKEGKYIIIRLNILNFRGKSN